MVARPTRPSCACAQLQELGRWFCPLNLRLLSGTAFGEIARWSAGAQTWTQTWTLPPDQRVVKILSPQKSQHELCGVWVLFKSVPDAKFEPSEVTFLRLMLALFSPAKSVLLHVLKTIWHRTTILQMVRIMFWCNYLLERHWHFHCSETCRYDVIGRCNPFEQLVDPMLKVFLLITEPLMHSILFYLFPAEMRSSQYLLLRWCSRCHDTMHQLSVPIFHSRLSTWRLPI